MLSQPVEVVTVSLYVPAALYALPRHANGSPEQIVSLVTIGRISGNSTKFNTITLSQPLTEYKTVSTV